MMPEKFYVPWSEIDPTLQHGGIPGVIDVGWVGPDLGDNTKTRNRDMKYVFEVMRDVAASLSMRPAADAEGPPNRNAMEEVLKGLNWFFERVLDRTLAGGIEFEFVHAIPPVEHFLLRPIHYPLRSQFMDNVIFYMLGTMVEVAEANRNANHSCINVSTALRVLAPCTHLKKVILKDWFDQEVAGEISLEELQGLFEGVAQPGPIIVPSGQSQPTPDAGATAEVLSGIDVLQWYPTDEMWAIFAKKVTEMYKTERIWQPEGELTATEDVAPEHPVKGVVQPG